MKKILAIAFLLCLVCSTAFAADNENWQCLYSIDMFNCLFDTKDIKYATDPSNPQTVDRSHIIICIKKVLNDNGRNLISEEFKKLGADETTINKIMNTSYTITRYEINLDKREFRCLDFYVYDLSGNLTSSESSTRNNYHPISQYTSTVHHSTYVDAYLPFSLASDSGECYETISEYVKTHDNDIYLNSI